MSMQEFWERTAKAGTWAGYYDGRPDVGRYNFFTRREGVLRLLENEGEFGRILDVGCGTGDYAEVAARHHGAFFGIDYAPEMVRQASQRVPGHGTHNLFVCGSGEELPYRDDLFDLVMAMGFIEYFEDPGVPLAEIRRVMKPGATLVMQSFKKDFCGRLDQHVLRHVKSLLALFGRKVSKGPELPDDWIDIKYSRRQLDALLRPFGFTPTGYEYNNFHVFPPFLRVRFPGAYIRLSEAITRRCPDLCGFLAVNYIGKYRLQKDASPSAGRAAREGATC